MEKVVLTMTDNVTIEGDSLHVDLYNYLNTVSHKIGEKINEYHWREVCALMLEMENKGLVKILNK